MESITRLPGIRPLALPRLPADFFAPVPDPSAPAPLGLEWPRRGAAFRLTGCPTRQAGFRTALAAYEAAEAAAALARCSGDLRGFFAATTETHRGFAALEAFGLPAADLARLQAIARRRAATAARRDRHAEAA
ncbi:MAG: hypothetical protein ACOYOH_25350 [Paracraurococcus sp.]